MKGAESNTDRVLYLFSLHRPWCQKTWLQYNELQSASE